MGLGAYITQTLAPDLRKWAAKFGASLSKTVARRRFGSIGELIHMLQAGDVRDGTEVEVVGRITPFGAFSRSHIIPAMIGSRAHDRRGPAIMASNPIVGVFSQMLNHLHPVALFPPVAADVNQGTLLPPDAPAVGFIGLIPMMTPPIARVNVLYADRYMPVLNRPSRIRGVARLVGPAAFAAAGFPLETFEALRQLGDIWIVDLTGSESSLEPLDDQPTPELWGGLYAQGHFEYQGRGPRRGVVEAYEAALAADGFKPEIFPNQGARKDISIIAQGVRMLIDGPLPVWSLHLDCELTAEFAHSTTQFDALTNRILEATRDAFTSAGTELLNPLDVDVTYTRSADTFRVLTSEAAESLTDPLLVALREWHRMRNAK